MLAHIDRDVPVVVISNFVEAHHGFLSRAAHLDGEPSVLEQEAFHADRTLLWVGDPKLVFVSQRIAHASFLCKQLGYLGTRYVSPQTPTDFLCRDILREKGLLNALADYAGAAKSVQIVPYATTPDFLRLVDWLRGTHGLHVLLPESPAPEAMWLRDYVDTKTGFHQLAGRWLPNASEILPESYQGRDVAHVRQIARWFHAQGRQCIAKPDTGESGLGTRILSPPGDESGNKSSNGHAATFADGLADNPFWGSDPIQVEEYIAGRDENGRAISPSVEVFVPHKTWGDAAVTYVSEQLFHKFGEFNGVLVSPDQRDAPWYESCVASSLQIGRELQARGYVGHFDIDAVVDSEDRPVLLELNARRTGGTHVHDFGCFAFGADYAERVAFLSWEGIDCGGIRDWDALKGALDGLLFPIAGDPRGVVVTITSALVIGQCGVLITGADRSDVLLLQEQLSDRIANFCPVE